MPRPIHRQGTKRSETAPAISGTMADVGGDKDGGGKRSFTGVMKITVLEGKDIKAKGMKKLEPLVSLSIDEIGVARTTAGTGSTPKWGEEFELSAHRGKVLEIQVLHKELLSEKFVASVQVPMADFIEGPEGNGSLWVGAGPPASLRAASLSWPR